MSDTITIYRSNAGLGCMGPQPSNLPPGVMVRGMGCAAPRGQFAGVTSAGKTGRVLVAVGGFAAILLSAYGLARSSAA